MTDSAHSFEVVVVGGGPAGLAAACVIAESGRAVALIEGSPWLGGQIWRGAQERPIPTGPATARRWLSRFHACRATLLDSTRVIAMPRPGVLLAEHENSPREIKWQRLILATGARELFLPFPGWAIPGVMGPGGLQALAKQGWPVENQRIVVAGSGPLLLAAADGLTRHGACVQTVVEQAPWQRVAGFALRLSCYPAKLCQALSLKMRLAGVPYRCGVWPVRAEGDEKLRRVILTDGRRTWAEPCNLLACGFGLVPNVELAVMLGCELSEGNVKVDAWQATTTSNVYCAGEPTGIGGADCALVEGQIAGFAAVGKIAEATALFAKRAAWHRFRGALARAFALRSELKRLATNETIVCRCEDVTFGRLCQFTNWRQAKLLSRCGMGSCQGRVCGGATQVLFGWGAESIRPPLLPAKVGSLISSTNRPDNLVEATPGHD